MSESDESCTVDLNCVVVSVGRGFVELRGMGCDIRLPLDDEETERAWGQRLTQTVRFCGEFSTGGATRTLAAAEDRVRELEIEVSRLKTIVAALESDRGGKAALMEFAALPLADGSIRFVVCAPSADEPVLVRMLVAAISYRWAAQAYGSLLEQFGDEETRRLMDLAGPKEKAK